MFIVFLYCIVFNSVPCEPNTTYEEQHVLIEQLKAKLDLNRIKTFYCQYTLLSEYFFGDFAGKLLIKNREIAWDNYFDKGNFLFTNSQTIDVVNPDINIIELNETEQDTHKEKEDKKINSETEKSLINLIKSRLERRTPQSYIDWNKINFDKLTPIGKCYSEEKYYRHKGKELNVTFKYFDDGRTRTTKSTFLINWNDFYVLYPFLIIDLTPTGDNTFVKYITLGEFLDLPGPFHISKKDEYTILWHYTRVKIHNLEYEKPINVDIWVDNNRDIYRIDLIRYLGRIMDMESFKKAKWNDRVDCDYPYFFQRRIEFDNYQNFGENVRFPLRMTITEYGMDTDSEEVKKLELDLKNGKILPIEYFLNSTRLIKPHVKSEYIFNPHSMKINQELSEEIFRIPELPQDKEELKIFNYYPLILFVGGGILIVIIGIILTNRYLGWSI